MAKQRKRRIKTADEYNTENEFLKMKMMAEFGGEFIGSDNIPPEVENIFLKQIEKIQRAHATSQLVELYEYIGKPEYKKVDELNEIEVEKEFKRLMKLLNKKKIQLTTIAGAPVKELYRFITEELFYKKIEDINVKGWTLNFIYEDYYPNHTYDVNNLAFNALMMLVDKDDPPFEHVFDNDMLDRLGLQVDFEDWLYSLKEWQNNFRKAYVHDVRVISLHINDENTEAYGEYEVDFNIQPAKYKKFKTHTYKVDMWMSRKPEINAWLVNRLDFYEA